MPVDSFFDDEKVVPPIMAIDLRNGAVVFEHVVDNGTTSKKSFENEVTTATLTVIDESGEARSCFGELAAKQPL